MKVSLPKLREKVIETLSHGFPNDQAERIAEPLIWADMSGIKTQGVIKLTGTEPLQTIKPQHELKVERDTKLSQLINAGGHPATLASQQATDVVIQKAQDHGFGIVGVHNTFSSNGAQAFYAERIAKEDLIGIVMARSPASFAPFDSIDPLFGTNPIGFSFPTKEDPLVFDMATSAMTWYGLVLAKARGEQIPDNMAIDSSGHPTNDPAKAMEGALLPFDRSYKGSGIGMIVELLAGPLVGAAYGQVDGEWGSLFIAIDPELLCDVRQFKDQCSDLIRKIKGSRPKPGLKAIRLPGERARLHYEQSLQSGQVDIDDAILEQLDYRGIEKVSLYFIRHGETEDNVKNIFTGQKDVPLTDYGREEARQAAAEVRKLKIEEIIASDLSRARETAEIIADGIGLSREHIRTDRDAREVGVGDLVGQPMDQQRLRTARGTNPTVETVEAIERRLRRLLTTIDPAKATLIVGHNGSGRILMGLLTGQNAADIPMLANCQVFELNLPKEPS